MEKKCKDCKCLAEQEWDGQGARKYYCIVKEKKTHKKDKACSKFIDKDSCDVQFI